LESDKKLSCQLYSLVPSDLDLDDLEVEGHSQLQRTFCLVGRWIPTISPDPPPGDPDPDDDPVRNFLLVAHFLRLFSSSSSNGF